LRESEEKYRLLVQNANDAIFISQEGIIKFPNPKTLQILGCEGDSLEDLALEDFIHSEDRKRVADLDSKRMADADDLPTTYSFRVISRKGQEHAVQLNAVKIMWEGRFATLNFMRDITDQKRLEASLHQAQKMEAIGTLAGGIAHDFNNLLMGVQGRTSLMLLEMDSGHPFFEHLKGIEEYVRSAAHLTKQLLGLARGGRYEIKPTDMNEIVEKSSEMFGRTRKEIRITRSYEPKLWAAEVDRSQINQVLLNIYVNAWQAMPAGGELHLRTQNTLIGEEFARFHEIAPGEYVEIAISDTGLGMDEATVARIFDPFFTTKKMGRGAGLGLASSYGIIRNHHGAIRVSTELGRGSTFFIYLPATGSTAQSELRLSGELMRGNELILLIDDEDMILDVGRGILEKLGYKVLTACSGQEALDVFRSQNERIDLVILDMIMPDMGGAQTFDQLKAMSPKTKILLSSGYSIDEQASEILKRGCNGFIQKPFGIKELSQKIRKVVEARG
jgi:PAS domain S-box-containing protein